MGARPPYEFQVGEEGVARWTKIKLARIAGDGGIAALADDRWGGLSTSLRSISSTGLSRWKRASFYVFGAIEAEMLERLNPSWHTDYRRAPFTLGAMLGAALLLPATTRAVKPARHGPGQVITQHG